LIQTGGTFGSARLWYYGGMSALKRPCLLVHKETKEKFQSNFVINEPQPEDDGANYSCVCEITGAPDVSVKLFGIDAIQAVELAMRHLDSEFEALQQEFDVFYTDGTAMTSFSSQK
jgi:hypothetical protein